MIPASCRLRAVHHLPLLLTVLLACGKTSSDSGDPPGSEDTSSGTSDRDDDDDDGGCDELSIKVLGEDPPSVGDEWTVYMKCDDAVLTGTSVVRVDPVEMALVYDNVLTWQEAGECLLSVQVGGFKEEETVTIGE